MDKKNIIIVLLILILLSFGGYAVYNIYNDTINNKKETNEASSISKEEPNKTTNENNTLSKDDSYDSKYLVKYIYGKTYEEELHIYDTFSVGYNTVYAYQGQMYFALNFDGIDIENNVQFLIRDAHEKENQNEWKQNKNIGYLCYNEDNNYVCKTSIKESEIERARIYPVTLHGPEFGIFFIYKDGRVFANYYEDDGKNKTISKLEEVSKLKGYQVSDLIVKLDKIAKNNAPYDEYNYYLKLKDGNIKKINFYAD